MALGGGVFDRNKLIFICHTLVLCLEGDFESNLGRSKGTRKT